MPCFFRKTTILLADYSRICSEAAGIAHGGATVLKLGYLRAFCGEELSQALSDFTAAHPEVRVTVECGNHEELYALLCSDRVDLVLSDQRRAFSDEYVNLILARRDEHVEVPAQSALAALPEVSPAELKNTPGILVSSEQQFQTECEYYRNIVGLRGDFLRAGNPEEGRLMLISVRGFMPVEACRTAGPAGVCSVRIPLVRNGERIGRNYCAFWKRINGNPHVPAFVAALQTRFSGPALPG